MKVDYVKGSNIIGLEPRRMDNIFPAVNAVEAYWSALSAQSPEGAVPARSRIDPRGIESALAQAFILERIAPGLARFRLAGAHLADLMGMEVRGMPLTALFLPDDREFAGRMLERAFSGPARVSLVLTGERGIGRAPLDARMLLLPLRDEEGRVTRILGALEAKGTIGRQPRRFAIVAQNHVPIEKVPPDSTDPRHSPGLAEAAARGYSYPLRPGRPALRLIRGRKE
ncbi:PAS domain-containing protein [Frigidibacter sp. ROC022]|uniref:PAS domain-containing protein n=1 Tax=Frigidibacter sp. ROC022 TaxID=2971796 RepID=UPI00215B3E99|nr:PAS domain-containing protein [Frigidibacter sp. ROC022]MCR8726339.1 PAS domain-containing protein [Frigidibacter sp. ROC022]